MPLLHPFLSSSFSLMDGWMRELFIILSLGLIFFSSSFSLFVTLHFFPPHIFILVSSLLHLLLCFSSQLHNIFSCPFLVLVIFFVSLRELTSVSFLICSHALHLFRIRCSSVHLLPSFHSFCHFLQVICILLLYLSFLHLIPSLASKSYILLFISSRIHLLCIFSLPHILLPIFYPLHLLLWISALLCILLSPSFSLSLSSYFNFKVFLWSLWLQFVSEQVTGHKYY